MSQLSMVMEDRFGRVLETVQQFERDLGKAQRRLRGRRQRLEKGLRARRRAVGRQVQAFEKRALSERRRLAKRIGSLPAVRETRALLGRASGAVGERIEGLLWTAGRGRRDFERMERRVNQLERKVRQLAGTRSARARSPRRRARA